MELILWRHAEAEAGFPDLERALTEQGRRQAANMAAWLAARLGPATRILVSPARRAQQTAAALGRDFETVAALAPGAQAASVLAAAGWPDGRDVVVVVGHQPTLGAVAALLLCGAEQPFAVKKGGIIWLSHRRREDGASVALKAVLGAELL